MVWIVFSFLVYLCAGVFVFLQIQLKRKKVNDAQEANLLSAQSELKAKEEILKDLLSLSLGLIRNEDILALDVMLDDLRASISAEKGRFAITEAELEAVEVRMRELEELKRELEVSNMDAVREVEMLKAQERDVATQNEVIFEQLTSSKDQIDILYDMFGDNEMVQGQLDRSREEIESSQKQLTFYEEEVAKINQQYVVLKKAYDALDIEYAQLYEKRQQDPTASSDEDDGESKTVALSNSDCVIEQNDAAIEEDA